jgi:hypothetical protein
MGQVASATAAKSASEPPGGSPHGLPGLTFLGLKVDWDSLLGRAFGRPRQPSGLA